MRRFGLPLVIALLLAAFWAGGLRAPATDPAAGDDYASGDIAAESAARPDGEPAATRPRADAWLPPEAVDTLALIEAGGPFPYRRDGVTFENRERLLPQQPRGYYREYTVPTPGASDRGARRIVAGGDPPEVFYFTADHYRSFRRVQGLP
jgi:guanyl-specific ribonuclease Sa